MTDLLTDITFAVSPDTPGAVEFDFARVVSEGRPLYKASRPCLIRDLRPRLATDAPGLDQEGFEVCEVPYDELDAGDGWEDKYVKAMCDVRLVPAFRTHNAKGLIAVILDLQWLCRHLGAREVVYQNFHVRRRIADEDPLHPKGFDETKLQPAQFAHVDNSQATSFAKACATLGLTADAGKSERLAMINLWRPLKGPVVDSPLCFVDAQTIKGEDLELAADHYGVGSYAKYSPAVRFSSTLTFAFEFLADSLATTAQVVVPARHDARRAVDLPLLRVGQVARPGRRHHPHGCHGRGAQRKGLPSPTKCRSALLCALVKVYRSNSIRVRPTMRGDDASVALQEIEEATTQREHGPKDPLLTALPHFGRCRSGSGRNTLSATTI